MPERDIRVLVVDDSAVIRKIICDHISAAPGMSVAGTACDGRQALELLEEVRANVVTLDVQMPKMDGLATLEAILASRPLPVVMVSSHTRLGANVTLDALDRGALDYVAKPDYEAGADQSFRDELLRKIRFAAGTDVRRILEIRRQRKLRRTMQPVQPPNIKNLPVEGTAELADKCIAIGISTGGPPALTSMFTLLQPPMPPIVVVQHMPPQFTKPLAMRLDSISRLSIKEAESGDVLRPNNVLIAPGGRHLELSLAGNTAKVALSDGQPVSGHKPSADVMMKSAAAIFGSRCLGVIMTGMGRDGSDGCKAIRQRGGCVLGQDEGTSDVYGMNKVAWVEGNVDQQFALDDVADMLMSQVQRLWRS
jgi:two-component system, chemotaxis family, protein-glutamate methylesterase/glutaminase